MSLGQLNFLVLHHLSWYELQRYACVSSRYLLLVQSYLRHYPNTVNDIAILLQLLPNKKWCGSSLSSNPKVTWEIVLANPHIHWNYSVLSGNPNITWEIIQDNHCLSLSYRCMSRNPSITWDIISHNLNKGWDYLTLSERSDITWDIVQAYPLLPWDYRFLSLNPNITWDIVKNNMDKGWASLISVRTSTSHVLSLLITLIMIGTMELSAGDQM